MGTMSMGWAYSLSYCPASLRYRKPCADGGWLVGWCGHTDTQEVGTIVLSCARVLRTILLLSWAWFGFRDHAYFLKSKARAKPHHSFTHARPTPPA